MSTHTHKHTRMHTMLNKSCCPFRDCILPTSTVTSVYCWGTVASPRPHLPDPWHQQATFFYTAHWKFSLFILCKGSSCLCQFKEIPADNRLWDPTPATTFSTFKVPSILFILILTLVLHFTKLCSLLCRHNLHTLKFLPSDWLRTCVN